MNDSFTGGDDAFAAAVREVRGEKKWYHCNWEKFKEVKTWYVIVSSASFVFLILFGVVTMVVSNNCIVDDPHGRCCSCLKIDPAKLVGQTMTRVTGLNSIFYGIVMIINSLFGFWYIRAGLVSENKYQLFTQLVTQLLEVVRALFDTWFETNPALEKRFVVREVFAYTSLALLIITVYLTYKISGKFGWALMRRGGILKPIREQYKDYQRFRAMNRMDVQSSALLFLIFGLYLEFVQGDNFWLFFCVLACDVLASRYLVKYLKQENTVGVYLTIACKGYVVLWWVLVCAEYTACRGRYWDSLVKTRPWLALPVYPDFKSIRATYNGIGCLAAKTKHDDRTLELIFLNLAQALLFRVLSMVYAVIVARRFGNGLKKVFYRELEVAKTAHEADTKRPEGGTAVKFVPKRKKGTSTASAAGASTDVSEVELASRGDLSSGGGGGGGGGADDAPSTAYEQYEEEDGGGEEQDAMEGEDGITLQEMRDDLAW